MSNERTLSVAGHTELSVSTRSGRVIIEAEERQDLYLESDAPLRDDKITVDSTGRVSVKSARGGSGWLHIHCPTGTDVVIGTVSGKVELQGQFGVVRVTTVSGSVEVDRADELDVRTISGNIDVERCNGRCRLQTKSGRATCVVAGDALVSTMSGLIRVDDATGKVRAQSASGKIKVGTRGNGDVAVKTMSGSVRVEVPKGVKPHTRLHSLTGKPRCDCEEGEDLEIAIRSLSGTIEVVSE